MAPQIQAVLYYRLYTVYVTAQQEEKFCHKQNLKDIFCKGHNHFKTKQYEGMEQFSLVNLI